MTKTKINLFSDNGRLLYEAYLTKLIVAGERNNRNIDSPFTGVVNCFSVYYYNHKWYFKDHSSGLSGDIFYFVALMNQLDVKKDFKKITEVITDKLKEMGCIADESKDLYLENDENGDMLLIADIEFSKPFMKSLFKTFHPLLNEQNDYNIRLVKAFEINRDGKEASHEFQWSKPKEAFFALKIVEERYYILYNPTTRKFYEWGINSEDEVIGWNQAIKTAYVDHVYLRKTLFITNTIEGLLNFYSLRIPCIAFINGEETLPNFVDKIIFPLFSKVYVAYDTYQGKGGGYAHNIAQTFGFEKFQLLYAEDGRLRMQPEHWRFFRDHLKKDEAQELLYSKLEYDVDFEAAELINTIKVFKNKKEIINKSTV